MPDYARIILDTHSTKDQKIQAAFKLENIADERSIRTLSQALFTDPSPIVRHECAFALGETAAPRLAGPPLQHAIQTDPSIFVRHEALLALGTLGDKTFIPFITKYLTDPEPDIRESADIALERLQATT